MTHKKIIIANWKANKPYKQALLWAEEHKIELVSLAQDSDIVICPDFVTITSSRKVLPDAINIGAQDCSQHDSGPWTGQISPQTLQEAGCTYCIIWHVETRKLYAQSTELIAQKIDLLNRHKITPIICVTKPEEAESLFKLLSREKLPVTNIIIGYEPEEAIGKEIISPEKIEKKVEIIKKSTQDILPNVQVKIVYGGGINGENITKLGDILSLDGFLIGSASLDFQSLKKIVLSIKR